MFMDASTYTKPQPWVSQPPPTQKRERFSIVSRYSGSTNEITASSHVSTQTCVYNNVAEQCITKFICTQCYTPWPLLFFHLEPGITYSLGGCNACMGSIHVQFSPGYTVLCGQNITFNDVMCIPSGSW